MKMVPAAVRYTTLIIPRRLPFNQQFGKRQKSTVAAKKWQSAAEVNDTELLPDFVIAKLHKKFGWQVSDKSFDYQGGYRKADKS